MVSQRESGYNWMRQVQTVEVVVFERSLVMVSLGTVML